jgi:hypothetical protein
MPASQPMCTYCWAKVPKDLRKRIDGGRPGFGNYGRDVGMALSAAQDGYR